VVAGGNGASERPSVEQGRPLVEWSERAAVSRAGAASGAAAGLSERPLGASSTNQCFSGPSLWLRVVRILYLGQSASNL
jgi:hypothetical protein